MKQTETGTGAGSGDQQTQYTNLGQAQTNWNVILSERQTSHRTKESLDF